MKTSMNVFDLKNIEYCYVLSKFVVIRYVVLFHLIVLYRSSRVFLQP